MIEKLKSENSNNKELISKMQSDLRLQGSQDWFSVFKGFYLLGYYLLYMATKPSERPNN